MCDKVGERDRFGPDKAAFKVGVDDASGLWGGRAVGDRPGTDLFFTGGKVGLEAQEGEGGADQAVESGRFEAERSEELAPFFAREFRQLGFDPGGEWNDLRRLLARLDGASQRLHVRSFFPRQFIFRHIRGIEDRLGGQQAEGLDPGEHLRVEAGGVDRLAIPENLFDVRKDLDLGPGTITGPEFQKLSDAELLQRLPDLHVFGRVSPEDKLRLVSVMQENGDIVAMTGDAVNDAAALKKADVGVAMGSGSEVTKQAANMVLTDDNFATLVHAVELGRDIYGKIVSQLRYTMITLFGVLVTMLLASALDVNNGQALTPVMLLFVTFLIGIFPAIGISTDSTEPGIMDLPPRDSAIPILNRSTTPRWVVIGIVQGIAILLPYFLLDARADGGVEGQPQTTAFLVAGLSTVLIAACARRDLLPAWVGPYLPYYLWLLAPLALIWLAVESEPMNELLGTVPLTSGQWGMGALLALAVGVVMEVGKALRRRRR